MSKAWAAIICVAGMLAAGGVLISQAGRAGAQAGGGHGRAAQERYVAPVERDAFDVDVLVGGRPLEELYARGRRYVEASDGAEYEVRIRNPLGVRVAVALSVDGLNTINARHSSSWEASKWVLEPYQTISLTGWQMSSARARRFYFTTERDSYASKLGRKSDLGVISAVFYREARPQYPIPVTPYPGGEDEDLRNRSEERRRSGDSPSPMSADKSAAQSAHAPNAAPRVRDDEYAATGIGRSVENQVRWVDLELERSPAAEVTIRYEYRDALYKLGVLPRPRPDDNALRRRERARGFEDQRFSPEP
ncbi:MAG TPA: hypothetical protein VM934_03760 [Pyrinomonadaceae bacterium]|nr:hypothetical protein [Pyrinomonadaceae bacterium]